MAKKQLKPNKLLLELESVPKIKKYHDDYASISKNSTDWKSYYYNTNAKIVSSDKRVLELNYSVFKEIIVKSNNNIVFDIEGRYEFKENKKITGWFEVTKFKDGDGFIVQGIRRNNTAQVGFYGEKYSKGDAVLRTLEIIERKLLDGYVKVGGIESIQNEKMKYDENHVQNFLNGKIKYIKTNVFELTSQKDVCCNIKKYSINDYKNIFVRA